jgi:phage N-6-adenine-methyltransferase
MSEETKTTVFDAADLVLPPLAIEPGSVKHYAVYADTEEGARIIQQLTPEELNVKLFVADEVRTSTPLYLLDEETPKKSTGAEGDEWITPEWLLRLATYVLGDIELDPASSERANRFVQARTYYTKEMDALGMEWVGRTWLNPPYSRGLIDRFIDKFLWHYVVKNDIDEALVLTNNSLDVSWAHALMAKSTLFCPLRGRVKFLKPDDLTVGSSSNRTGQVVWYFGPHPYKFEEVFSDVGPILTLRSPYVVKI